LLADRPLLSSGKFLQMARVPVSNTRHGFPPVD
jgi:hypothetical protein